MEKQVQGSIHVNTSPEQLWDALTNNYKIAQYMYGAQAVTDWKEGSPIDYYIEKAGEKVGIVKGILTRVEPPHVLAHTLFPVGWEGLDDVPENYLTSTYEVTPLDNGANLKITVGDFTEVGMGEVRYGHTVNGFEDWLEKIKEVAEGIL